MGKHCTVTTGARLHFGPLAWRPATGRDFGGWGVMVNTPGLVVGVSDEPRVQNPSADDGEFLERAQRVLVEFQKSAFPDRTPARLSITRLESLPAHAGLGSGTQLALAVGTGAAQILDGSRWHAEQLAPHLNRGLRSAVGVHGFELGGLIVDAGKYGDEAIGRLATRLSVPDDWRFVLVMPQESEAIAGEAERTAFQRLPPYPAGLTELLSHLILTEILPAVTSRNFERFADALGKYGRGVGEAFREVQGGIVHPASRSLWELIADCGAVGAAQTSWGPTLVVPRCSQESAQQFVDLLEQHFRDSSKEVRAWKTWIASPRNVGAEVRGEC